MLVTLNAVIWLVDFVVIYFSGSFHFWGVSPDSICWAIFFVMPRQTYLQVGEKLGKEGEGKIHFCAAIFEYVAFVFFASKFYVCHFFLSP